MQDETEGKGKAMYDTDKIKLEIFTALNSYGLQSIATDINYLKKGIDGIRADVKSAVEEAKALRSTVDTLPCNTHIEKIKGLSLSVDRAWTWIKIIVLGVLTGGAMTIVMSKMNGGGK